MNALSAQNSKTQKQISEAWKDRQTKPLQNQKFLTAKSLANKDKYSGYRQEQKQ